MHRDLAITHAVEDLQRHEGYRRYPYRCTSGKLTVGYGLNLEDRGLHQHEALWLLTEDVSRIHDRLYDEYLWFRELDCDRRAVICNMVFNLGWKGFHTFRNLISALVKKDYDTAAEEMLNSKWADQVGYRAIELADTMRLS